MCYRKIAIDFQRVSGNIKLPSFHKWPKQKFPFLFRFLFLCDKLQDFKLRKSPLLVKVTKKITVLQYYRGAFYILSR